MESLLPFPLKPNTRAVQSVLVCKPKPNPIEAEAEWEVEEELLKSWGKVGVVDGEFDVAFCTTSESDEAMVFTIKIPDPEACPSLPYFIDQRPRPPPPPPSILNHIKGVKKKKITTNNNNSSSCSSSFTPKKISPVSKVAEDGPPGPYPSRYYAVLDDHLYSVGGPDPDFSASTITDVFENYTLSRDSPLNIVSSIPTTDVWMLNLKCPGKGWERAPSMKYRRENPQTIVVDGKLYVFGGLGWLQPKDTFSGWMEVYDPKLRIWETLPNPPTYSKIDMDVIFAHSNFEGKDQIIINGPPVLEEGDSNAKGHYIAYDVINLSWKPMFIEAHLSWAEEVQCKRAQVVSTTLYWTTLLTEYTDMIFIYGYNAYSRGWTRRKVNIRSILIEGEDFLPTGPGFLHLADFKFCLLLFSYRRPHYYLNCLIFDLYGEAMAKHTAMVRPVLHFELESFGFLRIEYTAQQRKSRGLEGKEEGEEEEEEREEGEMVRLGRKCRNINIGTRMAGTMFIFHVYKLYILIPVLQSWSACSISIIYIVYAQYILQDVFPPLLWVCINLFICVMYVLF